MRSNRAASRTGSGRSAGRRGIEIGVPWNSLEPRLQHRAIDLTQESAGDVDDAVGIDAEQVAIEREVMDRAQGEAVDDCGDARGLDVRDDVHRLDQLAFAQGADRAAVPVGATTRYWPGVSARK